MSKPKTCSECGRPLGDLGAPGMVGQRWPATSHRASVLPRFGTQRFRVLATLEEFDVSTTAAIADHLDIARNQVATRMLELHRGGYAAFVYDDEGEIACAPTGPGGLDGRLHTITVAGKRALREEREENTV